MTRKMVIMLSVIILCFTTESLPSAVARTKAGELDKTFGAAKTGIVTTDLGGIDTAYALALQLDGKIVIAGESDNDFAVVRYLTNGSLDSSFGTGGKVTTDIGNIDSARA